MDLLRVAQKSIVEKIIPPGIRPLLKILYWWGFHLMRYKFLNTLRETPK
jgi:hypothetical protein